MESNRKYTNKLYFCICMYYISRLSIAITNKISSIDIIDISSQYDNRSVISFSIWIGVTNVLHYRFYIYVGLL